MKRTDLIKRIAKLAKTNGTEMIVVREGANHTVYSVGTATFPIPRHNEIGEGLAHTIMRQAQRGIGGAQ